VEEGQAFVVEELVLGLVGVVVVVGGGVGREVADHFKVVFVVFEEHDYEVGVAGHDGVVEG